MTKDGVTVAKEIELADKFENLGAQLACGTPVIAYRAGSVPEVITDGVTGFVVDDLDEALSAAERVATLDRRREEFERPFSARRMAWSCPGRVDT